MLALDPNTINPVRELYVVTGQSNAKAHGSLSGFPTFPNGFKNFVWKYNETWANAVEPMSNHSGIVYDVFEDNENNQSSPMTAFANKLSELRPGIEIGIIPCAKGGTGRADWARNLSTNSLYGAMLARIAAALAHPNSVLKGILEIGSEEDTKTSSAANNYAANFEQWVSDVRSDLGFNIPVVHTRLGTNPNISSRPYWNTVRAQHLLVSVTGVAMIDGTGKPRLSDGVHYNSGGLVALGEEGAAAMNNLL